FAPYLLPVTVVTLIWSWLYQPEVGLATELVTALGMEPVGWLSDEDVAMWSIAALTVWWTVGFNFLLFLAALQSLPETLQEAAALDSAGAWRRLWSITLPQLRRTLALVTMLQVLASLKVFDQIYILTRGGPNGSTRPILEYIYDVGFTGYRLGSASAISYLVFVLVIIISIAQLRFFLQEGCPCPHPQRPHVRDGPGAPGGGPGIRPCCSGTSGCRACCGAPRSWCS